MSKFFKIYSGFCTISGIYGFSRGLRSQSWDNKDKLIVNKFIGSFVNGILYSIPIYNTIYLAQLINRIEIKYRNLDPEKYQSNYIELDGKCNDTF